MGPVACTVGSMASGFGTIMASVQEAGRAFETVLYEKSMPLARSSPSSVASASAGLSRSISSLALSSLSP